MTDLSKMPQPGDFVAHKNLWLNSPIPEYRFTEDEVAAAMKANGYLGERCGRSCFVELPWSEAVGSLDATETKGDES